MSVLEATGVTKRFGGLLAVSKVDLTVEAGEVVGLIGPNGAGKTTFFNCLTGMETPTEGSVTLAGKKLPRRPDLITKAGVARTFQNIRLFPLMTATENVLVGRHSRTRAGVLAAVGHGPRFRREEAESAEKAAELLEFVGLARQGDSLARNLSYGDQRRLEIARALATEPTLLLLDEPTAGMNPNETAAAISLVKEIQKKGVAVVLIEHDMRFVFGLCDRVAVLVQGEKLLEGTPAQVQSDERVVNAYLGRSADTPVEHSRGDRRVSMLEVRGLRVAYGAVEALKGIDLDVEQGQVVTLIGTNGAGKTTTLRTLSGLLAPSAGQVTFEGERLDAVAAHDVVKRGIAHSPEGRKIFPLMTVEENLDLGAFSRRDAGVQKDVEGVFTRFPRLRERRAQKAGTLSGGEQQMLAIGRALMSRPRLLMLDEPSMGLSPIMIDLIFDTIAELKASGTTILLVEQNASKALALADVGYVLETGRIVLSGPGKELLVDDRVRKAYLGED